MYISSVEVQGLADLPYCLQQDIPPQGLRFTAATPETTAFADAIALWFAAFDELALVDLVVEFGWAQEEDIEVLGEGLVEELSWFDGTNASMWVEDRSVSISLVLALDTETVQDLRRLIPQPEVQVALMTEATFSATVSLRWSDDYQVVNLALSGIQLGQWRMPAERPAWFFSMTRLFQRRFFRNHNRFSVAEEALSVMLSIDGFERYQQFQSACARWGDIRVVSVLDRAPMLLINNLPLRRWGMQMEQNLRVLASWYLMNAEIVWSDVLLPDPPSEKQVFGVDQKHPKAIDGSRLNIREGDQTLRFPNR